MSLQGSILNFLLCMFNILYLICYLYMSVWAFVTSFLLHTDYDWYHVECMLDTIRNKWLYNWCLFRSSILNLHHCMFKMLFLYRRLNICYIFLSYTDYDLYVFRVCARIYFSFATIFANQIFFCAIFLNLEPDFWPCSAKKEPGFGAFSQKKPSVFNPLNSGGLFYTHWYNKYGVVHFVFKAVDSL